MTGDVTVAEGSMTAISADITTLDLDAIVNAANEQLTPGGGVCGAIHRAAGPELEIECLSKAPCPTGEARITGGYKLPARRVIHAVGPIWLGGAAGEADLLAQCYRSSLDLAAEAGCTTIAFPAISTGIFGYPPAAAAKTAVETCSDWLARSGSKMGIIFCCFDDETMALYNAEMKG
ncbi:macro domain-containing protein [Hwanghaeella sp.]|uniref:macro domain-containing protein n=1 Tax=Hwanghaeella sp. TaxID=2605943 RepID=UPI003CCC0F7A